MTSVIYCQQHLILLGNPVIIFASFISIGPNMKFCVFLLSLILFLNSSASAGYTLHKGKLMNSDCVPVHSGETHYFYGIEALNAANWKDAIYHLNIVSINFSQESGASEANFYLGMAYFYDEEYEFANEAFSAYLNCQNNPRHFEDAIAYKLQIADFFRCGARKRFFGTKLMPKWASGHALALQIYDEVIAALPCHDFAAQSLYAKAYMLCEDQDFKGSIDAFQTLIRRFPKHELTPASYLCISAVYLDQAEVEIQNSDILALAEINVKRFQRDFPKDDCLAEAERTVQTIKELYAKGLWETGQFYERIDHPAASAIYYASAIRQFPDTGFAKCCRYRLSVIAESCQEVEICDLPDL